MRKEVGLVSVAASVLLIVVLVVGAVQLIRYRQIQTRTLDNNQSVSSNPTGLIVALNAPADSKAQGVMVNYLSSQGVAVRTRPIPNVMAKFATFQVVQDDVFVYTEQGDEPGLRRMDESGSLSASIDIRRGISGSDFWLVSADGKRLAWSESYADQGMTTSVLYSIAIDGSDKRTEDSVTEVGDFYLRPVVWVEDELGEWAVWYVKQPLSVEAGVAVADPLGPVFSNGQLISNDTTLLLGNDQATKRAWSPDKQFVAMTAENGVVEITNTLGDTTVNISPEVTTDVLRVVGWLNEDDLVVASIDPAHPLQSKMYVVQADGSFFRKVWEGFPIGVVPAAN